MHVAALLLASTFTAATDASGPAFWVEGETYYAQAGSVRPDRPPFASGGECLGANWGGRADHWVVYRFLLDRTLDEATLYLRYARRDESPSHFDVFCGGRRVAERWTLESTGGWGHLRDDEWRYGAVSLGRLDEGWHELKLVSLADRNNTNIDGFFVAGPGFQPPAARAGIEAFPKAMVRGGPNAPGPEWVDAGLTLDEFSGRLDDWYYPREEPAERAALPMPRLIELAADGARLAAEEASPTATVPVGGAFGGWRLAATLDQPEPLAVLEREFDRWGLIVYLGKQGVVAEVRKAVGRLDAVERPHVRFPNDYFRQLLDAQEDVLAAKVLGSGNDPGYEDVAGCLAPLHAYTFLGSPESTKKYIVQPDGSIGLLPNRWGADKPLETTLFDPKRVVGIAGDEVDPRRVKRGRLGGYLPAVNYGFRHPKADSSWELCALMEPGESCAVFVRVRRHDGPAEFYRLEPLARLDDGKPFFAALLRLQRTWQAFFDGAMQVRIADRRACDAYRAAIALALCGYAGLHPKYGMGGYWGADDRHDGFPPTTLSMGTCLLDWGLAEPCKQRLGYYLARFVHDDGTLNYYGPAVAEYGELLDLAAACVRRTGDSAWFDEHRAALDRVAGHLLGLRRESTTSQSPEAVSYGLLFGGAEADTRKDVAYYFSGSVWAWRGLRELGILYAETGRDRGDDDLLARGRALTDEAEALRRDVLRAAERSVIRGTKPPFLPPIAGLEEPFRTMTQDRLASYTNYRYWLETLSARCLPPEQERMMLDYRTAHGGELLGMTRFTDHLDDWPFWHQAYSLLWHDRVSLYLLAYYAHLAHHQMPGTFTGYEQVPIRGYGYRREYADYCVPAQLTIPIMTRWMLAFEDCDTDVLRLLPAVPRAWLERELSFTGAPTRWGPVSLRVEPSEDLRAMTIRIAMDARERPTLLLRLRHPQAMRIVDCRVEGGRCAEIDAKRELLRLKPEASDLVVSARFERQESER